MKSLEQILDKRTQLRARLSVWEGKRDSIRASKNFYKDLTGEEKDEYSRTIIGINELRIQIDALTYVINYDSVMMNVGEKREMITNKKLGDDNYGA